ncbi:MAG TPA: Maf family protein [Anaeromyxobacteraceae bacterium]|nr:Maf family protein [Anaeromyxobacteraceae bacterium]
MPGGVLTLASQSPRRRELLAELGIALEIRPARTDETPRPGERPRDYVARVARAKARAVHGDVVLAADTTVAIGDAILGKPEDDADAARMLRALADRTHEVLTGVCVRTAAGAEREAVVATEVRFAPLTDAQIDWYVATGEPHDKAGAYAIQGVAGAFVEAVHGSVTNVIGLPLAETIALLRAAGLALPWERR